MDVQTRSACKKERKTRVTKVTKYHHELEKRLKEQNKNSDIRNIKLSEPIKQLPRQIASLNIEVASMRAETKGSIHRQKTVEAEKEEL